MKFLLVFILLLSFTNLFAQDTEEKAVSDISAFTFTGGLALVEREDGTKGWLTEEGEFIPHNTVTDCNTGQFFIDLTSEACNTATSADDLDGCVNYLKQRSEAVKELCNENPI